MMSKLCDEEMQCCHRTALGMVCLTMADGFPLTPFFCVVKRRLKNSAWARVAGIAEARAGSIEGILGDEELEVSEKEKMVVGVGASPAVFSHPEEEEESNPGQVADCLLAVGADLVGGVQGLEDGDGTDLRWWVILFGVCGELPSQPKVELAQLVVPGVVGTHGCKYLLGGTKVFFYGPLLDGCSAGC